MIIIPVDDHSIGGTTAASAGNGNITYFSLPDQNVLPILKSSGIPYRVN
jgi:hypothetical protein